MSIRRKIEATVLFALIFISFIARSDYWVIWVVLTTFWGVLFLVDLMFLNEQDFIFEPNYKNWERLTEPNY